MSRYNMNVLADAKEEYTRQLVSVLSPEIYVGIKSIYDAAQNHCNKINDKNVLKKFQVLLSSVPQWNQSKVDDEFLRIVKKTDCDFIEDLITAVFVSHTKVLSSIKIKKNNKTIPVNVPVGSFFVHKCYIESARNFWRKAWLLDNTARSIDIQRNISDSEKLIQESIKETIRKLLPVRYILKEYIDQDYTDDEINDNIQDTLSSTTKNNLRKLVRNELQTLSKSSVDDNFSMLEIPSDNVDEDRKSPIQKDVKLEDDSKIDTKEVIENTDSKSDENIVIEQESVSREESSADEPLHLKPEETKVEEELVKEVPLPEQSNETKVESPVEQIVSDNKDRDIQNMDRNKELPNETTEAPQDEINETPVEEEKTQVENDGKLLEDSKDSEEDENIKIIVSENKEEGDIVKPESEIIIEKVQTGGTEEETKLLEKDMDDKESALNDGQVDDNLEDLEQKETINLNFESVENKENDESDVDSLDKPIEDPKVYTKINDYADLDNSAEDLKNKAAQEDTEHLETISNKSAIKEMKENIENSHKKDTESTNDDFSFFNDAVQFM